MPCRTSASPLAIPSGGWPLHCRRGLGGLLFAAGLLFRPVCLAMLGVMVVATIEQLGREMPQPEHALKNAFVLAGMFLAGPGRYTASRLFRRR